MNMTSHELRSIERDEAWLTGFPTPQPSREAVAATLAAVLRELSRHDRRSGRAPRVVAASRGFWAAAALLLLSCGIVWYSAAQYVPFGADQMVRLPVRTADPDEAVLALLANEATQMEAAYSMSNESSLEGLLDDLTDLESDAAAWDS